MTLDLDTFLVALYTLVDELYQAYAAPCKPRRPGPQDQFSDSEVLTLMLLTHWLGRSQRGMLRYAAEHWLAYFPALLKQSSFNRRSRDLEGVLLCLIPQVAAQLGATLAPYQVLDAVPVPLARRTRGHHHRLFANEAGIGKGGSDRDWYYGCQLLLAVTDQGVITGFLVGPAPTETRWVTEAFLCWRKKRGQPPWGPEQLPPSHRASPRRGPTGPLQPCDAVGQANPSTYLADAGLAGRAWFDHWSHDYGAVVLTPPPASGPEARAARCQQAAWRQIIERVNAALDEVFKLPFPRAKTPWGLLTRIAAKLLAFNLGIALNRLFGREDLALATLFNC